MYGRPGLQRSAASDGFQSVPSAAQLQVLEFVEQCVGEAGLSDGLTGPEALMELRVSQGYEDLPTSCPLASYDPELVALPSGALTPVPLEMLVGQGGREEVDSFTSTQTLASAEAAGNLREQRLGRSYEDPQFKNRLKYSGFVKRLLSLGMLDLSLEKPLEQTGMFFVKKKGGKQRLIFDCRRSNCHFTTPTPIKLATGDSIGKIETGRTPLYMASADLQNAFYTMAMPSSLRPFFGLKGLTAAELGLSSVGGRDVQPHAIVYPRIAVVPMGWSWAMWWCQHVNETLCDKAGLDPGQRLRDGQVVPKGNLWHVQYVDNLHIFGTNKEEVENQFWAAVKVMRDSGLTVHEIEVNEGEAEVLGWRVEESGLLKPTRKRLWRIRAAIRELLKRGRCSGQQLERLLGHITFVSLCRREALSVLGECYTYVKRHYTEVVPIWKSVRRELAKWDGISVMIFNNMRSGWGDTIYAVDASEWGLGVTTSPSTAQELQQLGAYVERWRFKDDQARNPRHFVRATDEELFEVADVCGYDQGCNYFKTVGYRTVDRSWQIVGRHRWRQQESMPVHEAQATLYGVRHILRKCSNFGKRHVILTDSMTAAVAIDKGRANSFRLRRVLQQLAALSLGSGCVFRSRWIPSEWNPADGPSRGSWSVSSPVRKFDDSQESGGGRDMGRRAVQKEAEVSSPTSPGRADSGGSFDLGHRAQQPVRQREAGSKIQKKKSCQKPEPKGYSQKSFSGSSNIEEIRESMGSAVPVESGKDFFWHGHEQDGQVADPISGVFVSGRGRSEQSKLFDSCRDLSQSREQGTSGASLDTTEHERMAETLPSACADAAAIRSGSAAMRRGSENWEQGAGPLHASDA